MMLQHDHAEDFVIATGQNNSLRNFVRKAFEHCDLNWEDYVIQKSSLVRPSDIASNRGNPAKAKALLGWTPTYFMDDVIRFMLNAEQ